MSARRMMMCLAGASMFVAPVVEARTKLAFVTNIESKTGDAPESAMNASQVQSAIDASGDLAAACGDVDATQRYTAALTVDGSGSVQKLDLVETTLAESVAGCISGVLSAVRFLPLSSADATAKIVVTLAGTQNPAVEPTVSAPIAPETGSASQVTTADTNLVDAQSKDTRPWHVSALIGASLGAGTFVSDERARAPFVGYSVSMRGTYAISDLLSASLRFDFDQELTESNASPESSIPRQFYFRETRIGLATKGLYKESTYTDIEADLGLSLRLPTDLLGQATGRLFGLVGSATLRRVFKGVGPGDLELGYVLAVRGNVGPRAPNLTQETGTSYALCRSDSGECNGPANAAASLTNDLSATYTFLEKFSFTVDLAIINSFAFALEGSAPAGVLVTSSPFVKAKSGQTDLITSTLELGYAIDDMFSVAVGLTTMADPFVKNPSGGYSLRFPFFDFEDTPYNTSQYYVQFGITY